MSLLTLRYAVLVAGQPEPSANTFTALSFLDALLSAGHHIPRVFFIADGVYCGDSSPRNRFLSQWQALQNAENTELVLCSASAAARELRDTREALRLKSKANIADGFQIGGLGQWLEACQHADRVLRFGG